MRCVADAASHCSQKLHEDVCRRSHSLQARRIWLLLMLHTSIDKTVRISGMKYHREKDCTAGLYPHALHADARASSKHGHAGETVCDEGMLYLCIILTASVACSEPKRDGPSQRDGRKWISVITHWPDNTCYRPANPARHNHAYSAKPLSTTRQRYIFPSGRPQSS